jgi:hypothetical protein
MSYVDLNQKALSETLFTEFKAIFRIFAEGIDARKLSAYETTVVQDMLTNVVSQLKNIVASKPFEIVEFKFNHPRFCPADMLHFSMISQKVREISNLVSFGVIQRDDDRIQEVITKCDKLLIFINQGLVFTNSSHTLREATLYGAQQNAHPNPMEKTTIIPDNAKIPISTGNSYFTTQPGIFTLIGTFTPYVKYRKQDGTEIIIPEGPQKPIMNYTISTLENPVCSIKIGSTIIPFKSCSFEYQPQVPQETQEKVREVQSAYQQQNTQPSKRRRTNPVSTGEPSEEVD